MVKRGSLRRRHLKLLSEGGEGAAPLSDEAASRDPGPPSLVCSGPDRGRWSQARAESVRSKGGKQVAANLRQPLAMGKVCSKCNRNYLF